MEAAAPVHALAGVPDAELSPKQRYWRKKFDSAPMVDCACGCGVRIKAVDMYGRKATYENGHNQRQHHGDESTKWAAQRRYRLKNPDTYRSYKRDYYRSKKLKAMKLLGNRCHYCGLAYDGKNAPVFEFHHEDPSIKDDGVTRMLTNKAWEKTVEELQKCVLACANCHNMQHGGGEW